MPGAVKAAVAVRMARQMNHAQPAPEGQLVAFAQGLVDPCRPVAEGPAPHGFHASAPAGGSLVRVGSVDILLLGGMPVDRSARPFLDLGQIPRMVEVAMSEEDSLNGLRAQTQAPHQPP